MREYRAVGTHQRQERQLELRQRPLAAVCWLLSTFPDQALAPCAQLHKRQPAFGAQRPAQRGDDILLVVDQQQGALARTPPKPGEAAPDRSDGRRAASFRPLTPAALR